MVTFALISSPFELETEMKNYTYLVIICLGEKIYHENILLDRLFNAKSLSFSSTDTDCVESEWKESEWD